MVSLPLKLGKKSQWDTFLLNLEFPGKEVDDNTKFLFVIWISGVKFPDVTSQ